MDQTITVVLAPEPTDEVRMLVAELEAELAANYPAEQRHGLPLAAIFQPHIRFFVARVGAEPAGCGGIALFEDCAELKRMYVRDRFRGRGVAPALLAELERRARAVGQHTLRLETGTIQHAARRFYAREGFVPCAAFRDYALMSHEHVAGSIFMEKRLSDTL